MTSLKAARVFVAEMFFLCALVATTSMTAQADTVVTTTTVGTDPYGVAINPAGTFAYVANYSSNTVSKINLTTDTVAATIPVGTGPHGLAINPAGTFAYVANYSSNTVSKINLATDTVAATIPVGTNPRGLAINPAGTFAYVTNIGSETVSKINLTTDTVAATIQVGTQPTAMAINPAGTFAYVVLPNTVSKINLATDTVAATIPVGGTAVAINPAGTFAYVTGYGSPATVSKINLATDTVVTTITVGFYPYGVAINPAGTFAYVTNYSSNEVLKISLTSDKVVARLSTGITYQGPYGVAINPAGTFVYVVNSISGTVSKINITTEPQSITFEAISNQLLGTKTVALSATAASNLVLAISSATPTVCTVSGSTVTMLTLGDCTINANQAGGFGWDSAPEVSRTFTILPSPLTGETGVSIKNGDSFSNTKQVTLYLIWPEYATAVRISNDGGFAASKTQTKELAASIKWELDDSVKGVFTKLVYVRFNGVADTTKTYTDDIILDTTAPVVESASATALSGSIAVSVKATDDITGVDQIQIKNGTTTVTKDYAAEVSVPLADISLSVLSMGVQNLAAASVEVRVSDNAGNWSAYKALSVPGVVAAPTATTPTVSKSKSATAKSIAIFAKIPVLSTSKVSLKVVSGYSKFCKVSGATLKGIKAGICKVTVTVTPKKGKAILRSVTLIVTN